MTTPASVASALMDNNVALMNRAEAAFQLHPGRAAIDAGENAERRASKQQIAVHMILDNRPEVVAIGKIAGDARPRASFVLALDEVRLVVAALPVVERDEDSVRITGGRKDIGHVGPLRHARKVPDPPPVPAAILGHLP